ncbi:hypothetical protein [Idiomarina abyssalis]|uniref:Uncharacterized protein n=1 Tax=Idiomarina abyssalis TaxID=86102 RepID=A0A8I1GBM3_9GAMM|nr:hypothetical protein [Idiomarina abyssalis]MBJ7265587.1 hypothetical protein [Idiomarina abyssalis]MBJ7316739.1 hypothetical protein [Idiomarina abyssalis]
MFTIGDHSFEVSLYRMRLENRPKAHKIARAKMKETGFEFGNAITSTPSTHSHIQVALSKTEGAIDYAALLYLEFAQHDTEKRLIVEQHETHEFVFIRIVDGMIEDDGIYTTNSVQQQLESLQNFRKEESWQCTIIGDVDEKIESLLAEFTIIERAKSLRTKIKGLPENDRLFSRVRLLPGKYALKGRPNIRQTNTKLAYTAVSVFVLVLVAVITYEPEQESFIKVIDEYKEYKSTIKNTISPVPRLKLAHNEQLLMLTSLPGWDLLEVSINPTNTIYTMAESTVGEIDTLYKWAYGNNFIVMQSDNKYQLIKNGMNRAVYQGEGAEIPLVNADEVLNSFRDAVRLYVPRATVTVQRDVPVKDEGWLKREVVVQLSGHFKEDLVTIANIIKGGLKINVDEQGDKIVGLPIGLKQAHYTIDDQELVGSLELIIYGRN